MKIDKGIGETFFKFDYDSWTLSYYEIFTNSGDETSMGVQQDVTRKSEETIIIYLSLLCIYNTNRCES